MNRAGDWLAQAEKDMEQAVASRDQGRHEWSCIAAQQAAEKAVKALHLHLGQEAWGNVVARLLSELPVPVDTELVERAKFLDNASIPARYPNSHPEGAPFEHFGPLQSQEGIHHARAIFAFVRPQMDGVGRSRRRASAGDLTPCPPLPESSFFAREKAPLVSEASGGGPSLAWIPASRTRRKKPHRPIVIDGGGEEAYPCMEPAGGEGVRGLSRGGAS